MIEAFISEPLADVGPVFLFEVSVVLFVVGAAAGELDGVGSLVEVTEEVVVEEFGAVIAVEAEEGEREIGFDVMDLFEDVFRILPTFTFRKGRDSSGKNQNKIGMYFIIDILS